MSSSWLLDPRNALLVVLALVAISYIVLIVRAATRGAREGEPAKPDAARIGTGFITNFFDTLGIGSYATTTALFRRLSLVPDEKIPGTLNVGHTLPTIVQAFIYTKLVEVDPKTLILLIAASVLGAWVGAGIVASWSRRRIQFGMAIALFVASALLLFTLLRPAPEGGALLGLTGSRLVLGFAGNVVLGALMTLGIGLYAPCMIMIALLGMSVKTAFPIMMGSCAFLMPVASARFIRERSFDLRASLGLLVGGIPAVLIAAFIVKSLPLTVVRWLVLVIVIYTAVSLLLAARRETASPVVPAGTPAPGAAMP